MPLIRRKQHEPPTERSKLHCCCGCLGCGCFGCGCCCGCLGCGCKGWSCGCCRRHICCSMCWNCCCCCWCKEIRVSMRLLCWVVSCTVSVSNALTLWCWLLVCKISSESIGEVWEAVYLKEKRELHSQNILWCGTQYNNK